LAVGEADVDALLARITSEQLSEWMAFYMLEPFGEERADLRMATLASLLANVNRDPKVRKEPYTAADFMLRFEDPHPGPLPKGEGAGQSWEMQKAMMKALTKPPPNLPR
jgi:hypothetical protein